jgi:hypothetical protein
VREVAVGLKEVGSQRRGKPGTTKVTGNRLVSYEVQGDVQRAEEKRKGEDQSYDQGQKEIPASCVKINPNHCPNQTGDEQQDECNRISVHDTSPLAQVEAGTERVGASVHR